MQGRVMVVDDDRSMCEVIEKGMKLRGLEVEWAVRGQDALDALRGEEFDAVLTDLYMPSMSGISLCERIKSQWPDLPVILLTAFGNLQSAIHAIRAGAFDFVMKPVEMDLLALTLERAVNMHALKREVERLGERVKAFKQFGELYGESAPMQHLYEQMRRIADSESTVLITGESGTGKELVARTLHAESRRREGPIVAVNCANLSESLLESELFGHVRGAYTDARDERKGLFLHAQGGTLVLDEIAEFPLSLQPKVLRALESRQIRPVGGDKEIPFDARVIAITNRDLETAVEEGRFRQDLYYRVNVVQLDVPALRSRGSDILLLAQHFVENFAQKSAKPVTGLSKHAAEKLLAYDWPGNVRELRNAIERAVALSLGELIALEDLPERIRVYKPNQWIIDSADPTELAPMEEVERKYILHVLRSTGGNRTQAARILGIERRTLQRKLQGFGPAENSN